MSDECGPANQEQGPARSTPNREQVVSLEQMVTDDISEVPDDPAAQKAETPTNQTSSIDDKLNLLIHLVQNQSLELKQQREEIRLTRAELHAAEDRNAARFQQIDKRQDEQEKKWKHEDEQRKEEIRTIEVRQSITEVEVKDLYKKNEMAKESYLEVKDLVGRVDARVSEVQGNVATEIGKVHNQYLNLNTRLGVTYNKLEGEVKDRMDNIEQGVNKRLDIISEKINLTCNSSFLNQSAPITMSPESLPKFNGSNSVNPINFLRNLKSCVEYMPTESRKLQIVRASLRESALIWWDMVSDDVQTFAEFEQRFRNQYWGQTQQMRVRQDLLFGQYRVGGYESREMYIIKKYAVIKHLTPPIAEIDVVMQLTRHFDYDVVHAVALRGVETIEQLIDLVKKLDDADTRDRRQEQYVSSREWCNRGNVTSYPTRQNDKPRNGFKMTQRNTQNYRDEPYEINNNRNVRFQTRPGPEYSREENRNMQRETIPRREETDSRGWRTPSRVPTTPVVTRHDEYKMVPERDTKMSLNNTGAIPKDSRQKIEVRQMEMRKGPEDDRNLENIKRKELMDPIYKLDF